MQFSTRYRPDSMPFDHILETCRWPVRKEFTMRIMRDDNAHTLATRDWHRLFPAVIG